MRRSTGVTVPLSVANDDTLRLTQAVLYGLRHIYRPGYDYQKAGVALLILSPKSNSQSDLFVSPRNNSRLMATMDRINAIWGRGTLCTAAEGIRQNWKMKREIMSPRYTSHWAEMLNVK